MLTCTAVACPLSAVVLAGCRRPPFSRQPMCGGSSALRRACPQPGEVWHELDSVQREAAAGRGSRSRPCCGSAVCKKRRGCAAARHCCRRGRAGRSASPGRVRRHSRGAALPAERGRGQRGRGAAARRAASVQIGSSLQVINVPLDWPSATSSTLTGSRGRSPATRTSRSRRDCSQRSPMACSARSARRPRTFRTCKRRRRPNSGGPLLDASGRVVGILIAGSGHRADGTWRAVRAAQCRRRPVACRSRSAGGGQPGHDAVRRSAPGLRPGLLHVGAGRASSTYRLPFPSPSIRTLPGTPGWRASGSQPPGRADLPHPAGS